MRTAHLLVCLVVWPNSSRAATGESDLIASRFDAISTSTGTGNCALDPFAAGRETDVLRSDLARKQLPPQQFVRQFWSCHECAWEFEVFCVYDDIVALLLDAPDESLALSTPRPIFSSASHTDDQMGIPHGNLAVAPDAPVAALESFGSEAVAALNPAEFEAETIRLEREQQATPLLPDDAPYGPATDRQSDRMLRFLTGTGSFLLDGVIGLSAEQYYVPVSWSIREPMGRRWCDKFESETTPKRRPQPDVAEFTLAERCGRAAAAWFLSVRPRPWQLAAALPPVFKLAFDRRVPSPSGNVQVPISK